MMHAFIHFKNIQNEEQQDYQYDHYSQRFLCLQTSLNQTA